MDDIQIEWCLVINKTANTNVKPLGNRIVRNVSMYTCASHFESIKVVKKENYLPSKQANQRPNHPTNQSTNHPSNQIEFVTYDMYISISNVIMFIYIQKMILALVSSCVTLIHSSNILHSPDDYIFHLLSTPCI